MCVTLVTDTTRLTGYSLSAGDTLSAIAKDRSEQVPYWIPFDPYKDETPFGEDKPK